MFPPSGRLSHLLTEKRLHSRATGLKGSSWKHSAKWARVASESLGRSCLLAREVSLWALRSSSWVAWFGLLWHLRTQLVELL